MTHELATPSLGFGLDLPVSHGEAIERVTSALKEQGFGVLTTIDVKATLKEKIGEDFRPYTILGACNPPLAHHALSTTLDVGLLLPCNVVVYETEQGKSHVEFMDPVAVLGMMENSELRPIADEVQRRLKLVDAALA